MSLAAQLLEYFPATERAFDYSRSKAALLLLTKYRTPDEIRRTGQAGLQAWLKKNGARSSAAGAAAAVEAAKSQHTTVPARHVGELIVAPVTREILALNGELAELDALISENVTEQHHAAMLLSMPGFGPVLAAEFIGTTGGDLSVFETPGRFAGIAGLAPAPKDSGRITGNRHRPRRYDRRLLRGGFSASHHFPGSRAARPQGPTTTANGSKAKPTCRPCCPWHAPTERPLGHALRRNRAAPIAWLVVF